MEEIVSGRELRIRSVDYSLPHQTSDPDRRRSLALIPCTCPSATPSAST